MKKRNLVLVGTLLAVALAAPAVASAQSMDGRWQAALMLNGYRCTFDLVMNAGRYREVVQSGGLMTMQSGIYTLSGNVLVRTVLDFEPKYRYVVDARSRHGRGGHYERNATPPGGSFTVTFISPDAMHWQDVNFGGTITFQRVP